MNPTQIDSQHRVTSRHGSIAEMCMRSLIAHRCRAHSIIVSEKKKSIVVDPRAESSAVCHTFSGLLSFVESKAQLGSLQSADLMAAR